jgi:hypothetical protein
MTNPAVIEPPCISSAWIDELPPPQQSLYRSVLEEGRRRGLRFAVGGGFASNAYTGARRNTKDLDLFVLRQDRDAMIAVLTSLGLRDYYSEKPYDRSWIYRGYDGEQIVDIIWEMANHRAQVDEVWVEAGPFMRIGGETICLIPPEETLWTKLYVLQRERCDWPDAFNLVSAMGPTLDWSRLMGRLGVDLPLLGALLSVFGWICPDRARDLPGWIWEAAGARPPDPGEPRPHLLDTRPWLVSPCS